MHKRKIAVILFFIALLLFAVAARIIYVNHIWPNIKKRYIGKGEIYTNKDKIEMQVEKVKVYNKNAAFRKLGKEYIAQLDGDTEGDMKLVEITLKFRNVSNKTMDYEFCNLYIQNTFYNNGLARDAQQYNNSGDFMDVQLKPDESKICKINYTINDNVFEKNYWDHFSIKNFYLADSQNLYPIKYCIKLGN